jgi:hypothetical protein
VFGRMVLPAIVIGGGTNIGAGTLRDGFGGGEVADGTTRLGLFAGGLLAG